MVTGQWTVNETKDRVWGLLVNPSHLVQSISNVIDHTVLSDERFQLVVDVDTGVGFARYRFDTELAVVEPGTALQVKARGTNAHNVVEFTANVQLADRGSQTEIQYAIVARARGGLASVAQRTVSEVVVRHVKNWLQQALANPANLSV